MADEHRVAVGGELVGERQRVERDGRGLVVAIRGQARRRVPAQPRRHHVVAGRGELGHQVLPRRRVVGEPVEAQRERPVVGSVLEVGDVDPVGGDALRLSHGRERLTTSEHMSLWAVYPVMIGFSVLFTWLGISGFKKRVLVVTAFRFGTGSGRTAVGVF